MRTNKLQLIDSKRKVRLMFIMFLLLCGGFIWATVAAIASDAFILAVICALMAIVPTWCVLRAATLLVSDARDRAEARTASQR